MKTNKLAMLCGLALSMAALSACGGSNKKETISVWVGDDSTDFYQEKCNEFIENNSSGAVQISDGEEVDDDRDQYFADAGRLIIEKQKGSIGMLQRNFKIGFNRAARIMDQLEEAGVVGSEIGTKPRTVRMTIQDFEEYLKNS